jgi:hypothetical protein
MYSFAQRNDMRVIDEPLFGHFLRQTGVDRPSREAVLATMPWKHKEVLRAWETESGHLFLKHMGNHLEGWPEEDFDEHRQVILVRNPRSVLRSYQEHVALPTALDLCYAHQLRWMERCQSKGIPICVVDSDCLLEEPEPQLRALCEFLGLPWDAKMLQWQPGARPEDGVWAKYWYQKVHASSGWEKRPKAHSWSENQPLSDGLMDVLQEVQPIFERLQAKAIQ